MTDMRARQLHFILSLWHRLHQTVITALMILNLAPLSMSCKWKDAKACLLTRKLLNVHKVIVLLLCG